MAMIYHQLQIQAAAAKVYEALTTQDGISKWWTADCVVKPEVGFTNEFRIGTQAHYRMRVIHLAPGHSVEWKCLNQHDDWSGTQISFHLTEKAGITCLDFKHQGFPTESEAFGASSYQWALQLRTLKEYCESSTQQPDKPKEIRLAETVQTGRL
ncbi:MAG TPA: SRPBCC domain-containing protein [Bacteroidota bacterium]